MSIKQRLQKLEQRNNDMQQLAVIIVEFGLTQEQALSDWKEETGKPEPGLIVFIQRYTEVPSSN